MSRVRSRPVSGAVPRARRPWELQVEQDKDGSRSVTAVDGEQIVESLGAVVGHDDLVADAVLLEGPDGQGLIVGVVLYQQVTPLVHVAPPSGG